jgi:hypothetical protein
MQQAEVPVSTAGVRALMTPMRDLTPQCRILRSAPCL